jgi:ABC transport system ATP-binding/permease protein
LVLDEPTNDLDMDTLDLLEDLLSDYDGALILVSHDRDFIDELATSTIALDGRGRIVETPGGWADLISQNPGFFDRPAATPPKAPTKAAPEPPRRAAKLSYRDQRRLEELEAAMPKLTTRIAGLEDALHDPTLYGRDPAGFGKLMADLDEARNQLAASEEEWLRLEEKKDALSS